MEPFGKGDAVFFVDPFVKGSTPPKLSRQEDLLPSVGKRNMEVPAFMRCVESFYAYGCAVQTPPHRQFGRAIPDHGSRYHFGTHDPK